MLGYGAVSMNYSYEMVHTMNNAGYMSSIIGKNHFGWYNATSSVLHGFQYHQIYDGLGSGMPGSSPYDDYDSFFQTQYPGDNPLATGNGTMDWNSW